ncbi:hypothetical protein WS62_30975 [Burkholderia sp. ABCPW 14]|uniref:hypothetical protein n=1 Tax=Burkholderia sp. ABCPW 14 TaxID=1637860 RepID=UPI000770D339|nr:hypothetical protein [Burkholderia sp. ABCPW 14]KVD77297.1 hypothetical protein WS62_30975 [Burkholderia sp. ABCPW 14]
MTLKANLEGVRDTYHLCFVRSPWAYFTCLPLDRQCGDRWSEAPYELYAGPPYGDSPDQLLRVAFDGPLLPPEAGRSAVTCSVVDINEGLAPWLRTESYFGGEPLSIAAGATLGTFVETLEKAGGTVFIPLGWGELPRADKRAHSAVASSGSMSG